MGDLTLRKRGRRDHAGACDGTECRCACGSLVARLVDGAVELKCRRCKRTHRVPLAASSLPACHARPVPLGEAG